MAYIDDEGRRVKEAMPLEGLRAAITESMTRSKRDFPQGTGSAELDITKLIQFRNEVNEKLKESGKKITFTVSNLGTYLIDDQHPFLVPPQACIFGISRNRVLPVYNENMEIVPANLTLFSLTIDHGFTDGVNVAKFLTSVNKVLQDPWTYMYHKADPADILQRSSARSAD